MGIHHLHSRPLPLRLRVSNRLRYGEQVGLLRPQAPVVIHRVSSSGSPFPQVSSLREGCVQRTYSTRPLPLLNAQPATPETKVTALISSSSIFHTRSFSQNSILTVCPSFGFAFEFVLSHG